MSYKRNFGTIFLNGCAAVVMMARMLAYAKTLPIGEFGTLSVGILISASLTMISAFGFFLLMQRDLPQLFASGRVTRGMIMMIEVTIATVACAIPMLLMGMTGITLASAGGGLLALATIHGLSNQLFGIVSTESKSRLLQTEFSGTLFLRSIAVSVAGILAAWWTDRAEAILMAEICATLLMVVVAAVRASTRYGRPVLGLCRLAIRHLPKVEWRTAAALFTTTLLAFLVQNADRWTASSLLDKHDFAAFAFIWTLLAMASTLQTTINANLFPSLAAQLYHDGPQAVARRTRQISVAFFAVLAVLAIPGYWILKWGISTYFSRYASVTAYLPLFLAAAAFRSSDFE